MRTWNKLAALLLAAVMTFGLAATASASDEASFEDVAGHWGEEEITQVLELGLMDPKTDNAFAPDENLTRAELVEALYRLSGSPAVAKDAENPFTDVADDASFRDAVLWAYGKGIVGGTSTSTFEPEGDIQRQQIAKIMDLYAASAVGKDELVDRADQLSGFPDAADVAEWASAYMNWAVASELINGTDGQLLPSGTATRAQIAAILCRYMEDANTGDASLDKPRNEDGIGENELLVVSFGTSYNDSRRLTIGAIEDALEEAFPDYSVRRGFTSNIIIEHVQRREGEVIDDVTEALERAKANGVKNLLVQPTHLMNGYEYGDLVKELEKYAGSFETIQIGDPLLTTDDDFTVVAQAMIDATADLADGETAVCFMGHGTEAASNGIYDKMQEALISAGHDNYFVGTVESEPTAEDLVEMVKEAGFTKVILRPMMIVAGDHANNDMAGDDEDSWKTVFENAGLEVQCVVEGLGQLEAVQQLLVAHAKDAKALGSTGIEVEPNPGNAEADAVADGVYTIEVASTSSMFRVVACELTVSGGKMTAVLTLSGTGYSQMYAGTAAEAESASDAELIGYVEDADGKYTFTVPVAALDEELSFAALGTKWYDRGLTFESASLQAK